MARKLQYLSQLDPGQVMKNVHDEEGNALRVAQANSEVPAGFSKIITETNAEGSVTKATFYTGTSSEKTKIITVGDVSSSLNNTYFLINNAEDEPMLYVWYNVDGAGTDPTITGRCGIEISISENDPASIVARATQLYLNNSEYFTVRECAGNVLLVENNELGQTTNSSDVTTGFTITTTSEGVTKRIKCIDLPEETGIRYIFNYGEGKFETHLTDITVSVTPGDVADTPAIINTLAPLANTEYSVTLPVSTKKYEFQLRGGDNKAVRIQYSFISGDTSTNYYSVKPGNSELDEGLLLASPLTIYFEVTRPGQVLETRYWT